MIVSFSKEISLCLYIGIFLIAGLLLIESDKKHTKFLKVRYFVSMSLLISLSTLRYGVGTDYFTYKRMYVRLSSMSLGEYIDTNGVNEIGIYLLNKIARLLGGYHMFLFLTATIILSCIYYVLYREKEKVSITIGIILFLFLHYATSFNIIAQYIAVSIVFIGYKFVIEQEGKKFFVTVLLASLFHNTALLVLPIYLIWSKKKNKLIHPALLILIVGIFILLVFNYQKIIEFLATLQGMEMYGIYTEVKVTGSNRDLFVKLLIFLIVLIRYRKLILYDNCNKLYILLMFLNIIFAFTGFTSPFIKRMGLYFEIVQIFVLSSFIETFEIKKEKRVIIYASILCSILLFVLIFYVLGQANIIPYRIIKF